VRGIICCSGRRSRSLGHGSVRLCWNSGRMAALGASIEGTGVSASRGSEDRLKVVRGAIADDGMGISEANKVGARARFWVEKLLRFMGRLRTFIVVWWCGGGGRFNSAKVWSGVLGSAISVGAKLRGKVIEV
jgi:hypothetical protein